MPSALAYGSDPMEFRILGPLEVSVGDGAIKLGGPKDMECVAAIRDATNAMLTVDANAGWSREQAQWIIPTDNVG